MPPSEGLVPVDNCQQLLTNALVDAGVVGIGEAVEQPVLNRAFTQVNWLLAQWARKRWLCYQLVDYGFVSDGSQTYSVGKGMTVDINPRPDRLEYAFLRLTGSQAGGINSGSSGGGGGGGSGGLTFEQIEAMLAALPTTLPATPGQLWNDGGVIAIS